MMDWQSFICGIVVGEILGSFAALLLIILIDRVKT